MLGLFVFFYASASYANLCWYRLDLILIQVFNDIKKKFIFAGFSAWLLLMPLSSYFIKKNDDLLKENWKKLHRAYLCNFNFWNVTHFIWLVKNRYCLTINLSVLLF